MDFSAEEYIETVLIEDACRKGLAGINDTACSECCEEDKEVPETDEDLAFATYEYDLIDGVYVITLKKSNPREKHRPSYLYRAARRSGRERQTPRYRRFGNIVRPGRTR